MNIHTLNRSWRPVRSSEAGIAIGPILFVIAVLGILASAIAAGSGSFTAGSSTEGNRTKAAAMIEIGQNLKIGFDRITGSSGIDVGNVIIDVNHTSEATDLFSPLGGGITIPSIAMAGAPATDQWYYPRASVPGVGTGGSNYDQLAVLNVTQGVCQEINNKVFGATTVSSANLGDWQVSNSTVAVVETESNWPKPYRGRPTGCVFNNGQHSGYYFYQVIGIQ